MLYICFFRPANVITGSLAYKWHSKKDFTTYTYKCYGQTRTGTVAARLKNGLSTEGVCPVPLVQDWKMNTLAQYCDAKSATEADVSGKLEALRRHFLKNIALQSEKPSRQASIPYCDQ